MIAQPALPRAVPIPVAIPVREWLPWLLFAGAVLLLLVYIVGLEQGAAAMVNGNGIHEWVHDSRHLLGFPCH
jgi:hypothetical protein